MYLTVHLKSAKDGAASRARKESAVRDLLFDAERVGAPLEPLDDDDFRVATSFTAEVSDRQAAERVISEIKRHPIVETAYLKPHEALP